MTLGFMVFFGENARERESNFSFFQELFSLQPVLHAVAKTRSVICRTSLNNLFKLNPTYLSRLKLRKMAQRGLH